MSDTPDNHPQLPGLETPHEEFDVAEVAERIADSSVRHQDAIARRYDETSRRYDGTLPESDKDDNTVEVAQDAGSSAVADVVSIEHIDEDPTQEQRASAQERHPSSGPVRASVPDLIRKTREHLQSLPTPEELAIKRRREELEAFVRRPKDPRSTDGLPKPPDPPKRTSGN